MGALDQGFAAAQMPVGVNAEGTSLLGRVLTRDSSQTRGHFPVKAPRGEVLVQQGGVDTGDGEGVTLTVT